MAELDPNIILAGKGPVYEPLEVAALRAQAVKHGQQTTDANAQTIQIGAEQLQGDRYKNQETALQLQEQQEVMKAVAEEKAARALSPAASIASPVSVPTRAPSYARLPDGLIDRTSPPGQFSGPLAGLSGQAATGGYSPSPAVAATAANAPTAATAAATPPATANSADFMDSVMNRLQGRIRPSAVMAMQTQNLGIRDKIAAINKLNADAADTTEKMKAAHTDAVAANFQPVKDGGYTATLAQNAIEHMRLNGFEKEADQFQQRIAADPDNIKKITDQFLSGAAAARVTAQSHATTAGVAAEKQANEADKQIADAALAKRQNDAAVISGSPDLATAHRNVFKLPLDQQQPFLTALEQPDWQAAVTRVGLNPEQQTTADIQAGAHAETARHNLSDESIKRVSAAISGGHLAQIQMVNGLKYGPGTQEYWVKQLTDNPDSVKEMPPELRSSVGQAFRQSTGLPLPTPLSGTTQSQETAARNALDGASFIQKALQNPEIRANIGPIMGRLGNAEQSLGAAPNLSPQAAQLAQELRTRMRYFVFQEGKAVLGGRMPQELMKQLEQSSPNVRMTPNMLMGALSGASDNAKTVMDNADKQRFGGQMRTREMRGVEAPAATAPVNPFRK